MDRRERINDPTMLWRLAFQGYAATLWTSLPGEIVAYDPARLVAEVQPTLQVRVRQQDGTWKLTTLPVLPDVPVVFPQGGGFVATMPLAAGDPVLLVFADRSIDSWWQSGGVQAPAEDRYHDLSDAFCIPGPFPQNNLPVGGASADRAELRSMDGSLRLALTPGGSIEITAPGGVNIDGNLTVSGSITADGEVTAGDDAIGLTTHVHGGVDTGSSNTSPPEQP